MRFSHSLVLLFAFSHRGVFALPQLRTIETTITAIITAREESSITLYAPATTPEPLLPRGNYLASELAEIQSKITKACSPATTSSGWQIYACDNAVISSLDADVKQFYDTTTGTTTKFSTVTVVPIEATRARRRNDLTLGNTLSTLEGLSSSVNLGAILPSSNPTPDSISPDVTLFVPQAVTLVVPATATALQDLAPLASGDSVGDGFQE
ncbi:hypothetical protein MFRU_050g00070 [Monilinia fructicola]|uniref:Protein BIG1 n=1 Tax=Monilinia fructicola TaxID=38448 RepID=A0A5M9K4P4_MONFR|nr:hypothetical protein EYC84_006055 [Monilinia fructicola]KAG4025789.1 hypothetical protein MFRU_050g00070 [Monilinia fructicola]